MNDLEKNYILHDQMSVKELQVQKEKLSCLNCEYAMPLQNGVWGCDDYMGVDGMAMPVHVEPPWDEVCKYYAERKEE